MNMSWIAIPPSLALALASTSLQSEATQTPAASPPPEELARQVPIIVEGSREEAESNNPITGSRIRSENHRKPTGVSTNTGISGLTPGSGMGPLDGMNPMRTLITTSCVSDNDMISERASCLFLQAQSDVDAQKHGNAANIYRYLVSSQDFTKEEQYYGGIQLLNLAQELNDEAMREEAIIRLLENNVMPESAAPNARRNLAQMAMARGNMPLAIERLEEHVAISDDDAVSFANLAILRRDLGRNDAAQPMQRAIELQEAKGNEVPQGWRDFVRMESAG